MCWIFAPKFSLQNMTLVLAPKSRVELVLVPKCSVELVLATIWINLRRIKYYESRKWHCAPHELVFNKVATNKYINTCGILEISWHGCKAAVAREILIKCKEYQKCILKVELYNKSLLSLLCIYVCVIFIVWIYQLYIVNRSSVDVLYNI